MVAFDATMLSLLIHPGSNPPLDSQEKPVARCRERVEYLVEMLQEKKEKILIPTPALSEVLVIAGSAGPTYLNQLNSSARFRICPFDQKAAVEAAIAIRNALNDVGKASRKQTTSTWAKVKYDRQIVAIAKAEGAHTIYSDDEDVRKYAAEVGIKVVRTEELPLPPAKQMELGEQNAQTSDGSETGKKTDLP
jgi:predicted nucleic acid-binding protein